MRSRGSEWQILRTRMTTALGQTTKLDVRRDVYARGGSDDDRLKRGEFHTDSRVHQMDKEKHITILGVLHIVRGSLVLLVGLIAFAFFVGIGSITGDTTAMGVLGLIGLIAVTFLGVLGIPSILAGIGLLKRQEWGRILALVVGFVSLIDFPIGTALGIYTILILLDDSIRPAFSGGTRVQPITMPHAPMA